MKSAYREVFELAMGFLAAEGKLSTELHGNLQAASVAARNAGLDEHAKALDEACDHVRSLLLEHGAARFHRRDV